MLDITTIQDKIIDWLNRIGISVTTSFSVMWLVLALIILIFILWLTLRRLHLFNAQVHTLKDIDLRLKGIQEGFAMFSSKEKDRSIEEELNQKYEFKPVEDVGLLNDECKLKNAPQYNVGKSGRIYTEDELELQIKE